MTRVHVLGASGYAGLEMLRLVLEHPSLELGAAESASSAGETFGAHSPALRRSARTFDAPGSIANVLRAGDCVVTAGSHGAARACVPQLLGAGARVVDLSADYRFDESAVYGYAPLYREQIASASLIANPGCYPTATLLATLPLAPFRPQTIVVDAKSGISGAGRTPSTATLYAELEGEVRAYGLDGHRHEPEIERQWHAGGLHASLVFTPHVLPVTRGMLVDAYAVFASAPDPEAVVQAFASAYAGDPFVRLVTDAPSLRAVARTNDAEVHVSVKGNVVRTICAIDNLGKGAAAQALANINLMYGYPEALGLANSYVPV
ncbi:MAG TPA: N-acetyl-gamma-glutamyl-phosphate reductase [Candidatus Baltobacteraceae bacterium]|nr:N-acetyl-gamma-glutamyl-phosphate reductase [Candidatus Baltobacteraceae bacterium]